MNVGVKSMMVDMWLRGGQTPCVALSVIATGNQLGEDICCMATHIKNSLSRSSHRSSGKTGAFAAMLIVVLASAMLLCAAGCNPKAAWSDTGGDQVGVKSVVTCFVYDPTHDILYAGTEGEGLWRCTKASTSPHWSYAGNRLFDTVVSLAYDPARSLLYVSGGVKDTVSSDYKGGVWRSKNPGTSPNWVDTHSPSAFVDMAYD